MFLRAMRPLSTGTIGARRIGSRTGRAYFPFPPTVIVARIVTVVAGAVSSSNW